MRFYHRKLRGEEQPQKVVKFPHRARHRSPAQREIHFRHKPRSEPKVTIPPKVRSGRHRLSIRRLRPAPPPLIIPFKPKPVVPAPPPPPKPPEPIVHSKKIVEPVEGLVSIIILNYNTLEVLKPCVESILKRTVHPYELIVVDNGSTDGSLEWVKKHEAMHTVIENRWNHGWAKSNNRGIKVAQGYHYLLLNSDTIVRTHGWLCKMVACAQSDPLVGTVGAKLLYGDGRIQHIGGGIYKGGGDPYHPFDRSPANIREAKVNHVVPFVTGACLLIKRATIKKVGLLDEGFRFGFADVDYGLRVLDAGMKNVVCSEAVLTHLWAYTQRKFREKAGLVSKNLGKYREKWNINRLSALKQKTGLDLDWGTWAPWPSLSSIPLTVAKA